MSTAFLIEQLNPAEAKVICESTSDGKTMYLTGIFMQGAIKNRNGRIYPTEELARAVSGLNEQIKGGYTCLGELNHPESLTINLDRVSHIITEMRMDGDNAMGKAKILNTPTGNIVKALVEGGAKLGVSSRGTGDVTNEGHVQNFNYTTVDIVGTPSAPNAYPDAIYEAMQNNKIVTLSEAVVHDAKAQKYFKKEIEKLLSSILKK